MPRISCPGRPWGCPERPHHAQRRQAAVGRPASAGLLRVHNDSGDAPRIYAIDEKANLLGICNIKGWQARDWEDIALGPGPDPNLPYLYVGDIGDNSAKYPEVVVYRVPEPKVDPGKPFGQMTIGPADALRFVYPDGPRDAETLLIRIR